MPEQIGPKLLSWAPESAIETQAVAQAKRLAAMPFIHGHVALMPDCHLGIGATVGSVIATRDAIIPAAVGVDIGCGMIAVCTNLSASQLPDSLTELRSQIERSIPTGIGGNGRNGDKSMARSDRLAAMEGGDSYDAVDNSWRSQMGTLGGGNHFIEVCLDESDRVWIVLHSGSRGIGNKLATRHIKAAKALMDRMFITLDDPDLAYLPQSVPQFGEYIRDLLWAQKFALLNREEMMDRAIDQLRRLVPITEEGERINCHHNFTQREHHMNANVWVTRKGAIQMKDGQKGVIPGSMGTRSYIVSGLGNQASFDSAPHGAGRRMSRSAARKAFTMADLTASMGGIEARLRPSIIDEHPGAYKDIDEVMEQSKDLVTIEHTLRQVLNVKGD